MKKEEIVSVYCHVINHLTDFERTKVEKYEKDTLYYSIDKTSGHILEDAIVRIVKECLRT